MSAIDRKVLEQDVAQHDELTKKIREQREKEAEEQYQADLKVYEKEQKEYEKAQKEYEKQQKEAEEQYQKDLDRYNRELAEYNKQVALQKAEAERIPNAEKPFKERLASLEAEKAKALAEAHESVFGKYGSQSRSDYETRVNTIMKGYQPIIEEIEKQRKYVVQEIQYSLTYPSAPLTQNVRKTAEAQGISLSAAYEKIQTGKAARQQYQKETSIQQVVTAPRYSSMQEYLFSAFTHIGPVGRSWREISAREQAIKPTTVPENIFSTMPMQATDTRRPQINVDTGQRLTGQTARPEQTIKTLSASGGFDIILKNGIETAVPTGNTILTENIRVIPARPASRGSPTLANPLAKLAALTKPVPVEGSYRKPIVVEQGTQTIFSFQNIKEVKEPSAVALLEFQSQLKTETAPAASVYKGILEESGLKETPLARRIIDFYSAKPVKEYSTRAEAFGLKEAKGRKGIISDPLGAKLFDLETGVGSFKVATLAGYQFEQGPIRPEIIQTGVGFAGSLNKITPLSELHSTPIIASNLFVERAGSLEYVVKTNQLTPNPKSKNYIPRVQGPQPQKPLSNFGERLQFGLEMLESEQKKYAKFNDDAGQLLHVGFGIGKDILTGSAYLENLAWEGEAIVRKGERKTRDVFIPPTAFGIATEGAISGKSPITIYSELQSYEKTYGKGSTAGEIISLAIPLPGAKIKTPARITESATKLGQKIKVPQMQRFFAEKIGYFEFNINLRKTQKIAETRADEGIYGIEKKQKKLYFIERGFEEQRPKMDIGQVVPELKSRTRTLKEPIFTKIPSKQIIPKSGSTADVPLTVVEFGGKKKITITDITEAKKLPVAPKRIIISSPDVEFVRQRPSLKAVEISKGVFEITAPRKKTLSLLEEMEKSGYISHVATGRTASYKIIKKEKLKPKGEIIERKIPRPKTTKEMERLLKKTKKPEENIFDVVERPQLTQFYETLGGLGKSTFVKDVTKTKDIIPFGSKDLERKLESVGLGEKRKLQPQTRPYNFDQIKTSIGTGGSAGKAATMSETTKENIIKSFVAPAPKKMTLDYLQVRSGYVPRNIESNISGTPYETEYTTPSYPPETVNRLKINVTPITMSGISQVSRVRESQIRKTRQEEIQMAKLDTSLVTKQKTETLQKQKYKLDTSLKTRLRVRQIPKVRLLTGTIPILVQPQTQPQMLKQPQRLQIKQKQIQIFKYTYPKRPSKRTDTPRRPRGLALLPKETKIPKSVLKKQKEKADFLGTSAESQLEGFFKRTDITYGQKKIQRLLKGDIRVLSGKTRTARKTKEKKDLLGFSKKKSKFF